LNNPGLIIPGSVVEVFLKAATLPNALIIPVQALIEEQGFFYVFVQTGGESFQKREVSLGITDGIDVQVVHGLKEGERIVTQGAYQIKLSQARGQVPEHSHEH
jgi:multidrug efflux pump subunit AcrA (membrane-fusion protein)